MKLFDLHIVRYTYIHVYQNQAIQLTNLNVSFSMENEKRAAQVGFEPTAYVLLTRQMLYQPSY